MEFPPIKTPIKGMNRERKTSSKGFSDITSTYGLRGRDLEKFTTPAKKALADLKLTPKTNAASKKFDPEATATAVQLIAAQTAAAHASLISKPVNAGPQSILSEGPEGTSGEEKGEEKQRKEEERDSLADSQGPQRREKPRCRRGINPVL